jgi:hypothetical protein
MGKVLKTFVIEDEIIHPLCSDTWPAAYESGRAFRFHRCCRDTQGPMPDPLLGAVSDSYVVPAQSVCVLDMLRIL